MPLIANHHLLPLLADWSGSVGWKLTWDTEVATALRGYEARASLRQWPRPELALHADISSAEKLSDLRLKLAAALRVDHLVPANTEGKTGRVCVPWATRESWLSEPRSALATTLQVDPGGRPFVIGGWLIVFDAFERWAVAEISDVQGEALTGIPGDQLILTAPIGLALAPGDFCAPLFFGRLASLPMDLQLDAPAAGAIDLRVIGESYVVDAGAWPPEGGGVAIPPVMPIADFTIVIFGLEVDCDGYISVPAPLAPIIGYDWQFGDGEIAEGVSFVHTYLASGTYTIVLTVHDTLGRRASSSQVVTVTATAPPADPPDPPDPPPDFPADDPPPAPPALFPAPEDYTPPPDAGMPSFGV